MRVEVRGRRRGQAVSSRQGRGKVCFGFLFPDGPCPKIALKDTGQLNKLK